MERDRERCGEERPTLHTPPPHPSYMRKRRREIRGGGERDRKRGKQKSRKKKADINYTG